VFCVEAKAVGPQKNMQVRMVSTRGSCSERPVVTTALHAFMPSGAWACELPSHSRKCSRLVQASQPLPHEDGN